MGLFDSLKQGFLKTRESFSNKMKEFFACFRKVDDEFLDELEEILISSDVSVSTASKIKEKLRNECKLENISTSDKIIEALRKIVGEILDCENKQNSEEFCKKIVLIVGINGVGKTTSIAKMANFYKKNGKNVLIVAADTFRAAASEQLQIWAQRIGCPVVVKNEGADPGAVVFEGISRFKNENFDVMICDTAGRLHNKSSLMDELEKINRIILKNAREYQRETLLVLDACTGQNMINQVEKFSKIMEISGLILTKLDGTAKGGAVISVRDNFKNIPIKYICTGETVNDIHKFSTKIFLDNIMTIDK